MLVTSSSRSLLGSISQRSEVGAPGAQSGSSRRRILGEEQVEEEVEEEKKDAALEEVVSMGEKR